MNQIELSQSYKYGISTGLKNLFPTIKFQLLITLNTFAYTLICLTAIKYFQTTNQSQIYIVISCLVAIIIIFTSLFYNLAIIKSAINKHNNSNGIAQNISFKQLINSVFITLRIGLPQILITIIAVLIAALTQSGLITLQTQILVIIFGVLGVLFIFSGIFSVINLFKFGFAYFQNLQTELSYKTLLSNSKLLSQGYKKTIFLLLILNIITANIIVAILAAPFGLLQSFSFTQEISLFTIFVIVASLLFLVIISSYILNIILYSNLDLYSKITFQNNSPTPTTTPTPSPSTDSPTTNELPTSTETETQQVVEAPPIQITTNSVQQPIESIETIPMESSFIETMPEPIKPTEVILEPTLPTPVIQTPKTSIDPLAQINPLTSTSFNLEEEIQKINQEIEGPSTNNNQKNI